MPLPDGALVMCGGRAERFGGRDKGCVMFHGKPVAERVAESIKRSGLKVVFAFSRRTACSAAYASFVEGVSLLETPGNGYHEDLRWASAWLVKNLGWRSALVAGCDMPLLTAEVVRKLLKMGESAQAPLLAYVVSAEELRRAGFRPEGGDVLPTSVSLLDLLRLTLSSPQEELPYRQLLYSPAWEIWDFDSEEDLEVFEQLYEKAGRGRLPV